LSEIELMRRKTSRPALISIAEAGRRLKLDPRRVSNAVKRKQIPAIAIGSRQLIPTTALEKIISGGAE
jgi:hypothetical protein